jgi:DNA-binding NarL/FixJ family response regulator
MIMDVEMSPMDGISARWAIRERNTRFQMMILSQHDSPRFRQAAATVGAFAYILKDDLQDVLDVLAKHIRPSD